MKQEPRAGPAQTTQGLQGAASPWVVPRLIQADQQYHPDPTSLCVLCHLGRMLATVLRLVHMEDIDPGF